MKKESKKLKVLHIIPSLNAGGAEKLVEESTPIMKNVYDIDVEILLLTDKNNIFINKIKENNIRIYISPYQNQEYKKYFLYITTYKEK